MNPGDFEQHLQSQPMRAVPPEWRQEILSAARAATSARPRSVRHAPMSLLAALRYQLSTLLWPHPAAWAGLAAVWLVILGVNFATRGGSPAGSRYASSAPAHVFMAFQEQQRLLNELLAPRERQVADRPKNAPPRPRSERRSDGIALA